MVRASNCSFSNGQFPLSSEIFQVIKAQIWIFLVPVVLGLVQVGLFLEETGFFLRQGNSSRRTTLSLWILGVYPVLQFMDSQPFVPFISPVSIQEPVCFTLAVFRFVFSITSLISLFVPRASFVCTFVASIYHSITLWKFLALIRDFFSGSDQMLRLVGGQRVSPNPFPCCCCCCLPEIAATRSNLRYMTVAVYQLSLIRTILFFVTLILWTDEKYDYGDVGYTNLNSYTNAIIGISTFVSFYGYLLFYKATKPALVGYSLRSKFVCIILVLVLCGLQSGILETMGAVGAIPCNPPLSSDTRSQMIYYYSLAIEMFFISLFARYSFRRTEPQLGTGAHISQTETAASTHRSPGENATVEQANAGFVCEEALCTIEHSPLDQFDFSTGEPVDKRQERGVRAQSRLWASTAKERHTAVSPQTAATEAPSVGAQRQIATTNADDVTVV